MPLKNITPKGIREGIKGIRAIAQLVRATKQARTTGAEAAAQYNALYAAKNGNTRLLQQAKARARARRANTGR